MNILQANWSDILIFFLSFIAVILAILSFLKEWKHIKKSSQDYTQFTEKEYSEYVLNSEKDIINTAACTDKAMRETLGLSVYELYNRTIATGSNILKKEEIPSIADIILVDLGVVSNE